MHVHVFLSIYFLVSLYTRPGITLCYTRAHTTHFSILNKTLHFSMCTKPVTDCSYYCLKVNGFDSDRLLAVSYLLVLQPHRTCTNIVDYKTDNDDW